MKDGTKVIASVNLNEVQLKLEALRLLPREICEKHCLLPLWVKDKPAEGSEDTLRGTLGVVIADPKNIFATDDVKFLTGYNVEIFQAPEANIREAIARCYDAMEVSGSAPAPTPRPRSGEMEVAIIEHLTGSSAGAGPNITREIPKEVPMPKNVAELSAFVNGVVLSSFFGAGAKEVHFQPAGSGYVVNVKLEQDFKRTGQVITDTTDKELVVQYVGFITKDNRVTWKVSHQAGEDVPVLSAEVFTYDLLEGRLIIFRDFKTP